MTRRGVAWMARARWHVRILWEQVTPLMLVLSALLLLWLGLYWEVVRPLARQVQEGRQQIEAAAAVEAMTQTENSAVDKPVAPVSLSDRLLAFLPEASVRDRQLKTIYDEMQRDGMTVNAMEFRQSPVEELPAERFLMRMSVQGEYPVLRKVIQRVLNQHANLAIVKMSLEKSESAAHLLAISIEFEAYYAKKAKNAERTERVHEDGEAVL